MQSVLPNTLTVVLEAVLRYALQVVMQSVLPNTLTVVLEAVLRYALQVVMQSVLTNALQVVMQSVLTNALQVVMQSVPRFIHPSVGQGMTRFASRKPVFHGIGLNGRSGG